MSIFSAQQFQFAFMKKALSSPVWIGLLRAFVLLTVFIYTARECRR